MEYIQYIVLSISLLAVFTIVIIAYRKGRSVGRIEKHENDKKGSPGRKDIQSSDSGLWMAVPIIFRDSLLGVIGIGEIKNAIGNEGDLIKMIADIAGVALLNQALLGEAKQEANTDPLTGLNNRRYFFKMAQNFVEKSIREGSPISIFLFDIDHFKHYNDTNGHGEGDNVLKEISKLVKGGTL